MTIEEPVKSVEYDVNELLIALEKVATNENLKNSFKKVYLSSFSSVRTAILEHHIKPNCVNLILKLAS